MNKEDQHNCFDIDELLKTTMMRKNKTEQYICSQ
jgi:hypothetical protein